MGSTHLVVGRRVDRARAVRRRDEILGVVAHDLRGPLSAIVLFTEMLERSPDAAHARSAAAAILRATRRMDRLIRDLLDVTQLEAGRLSIEVAPERMASIVAEAADALWPLAHARSIALDATVSGDLPPVLADRRRLSQVLTNIGDNAVKFTPPGGRIQIRAEQIDAMVRVSVQDTGPGIPRSEMDYLFDRFWQGRAHDSRGLGLGLTIAKGIVEAHGGRIWAESIEGAGSTFSFTIPFAVPLTRDDPDEVAGSGARPEGLALQPRR